MSNKEYQLVAWTENGEVFFSENALQEQEMLLWDEYCSFDNPEDHSWERYERLSHVAWQWGTLLLRMGDYRAAYDRFSDGLLVCRDAVRFLPVPDGGGAHPFLPAMDDLYMGCRKAALEEGGTLEEILCEDGVHDYRRGLWEIVEARILFSAMKSFFP